MKRYCESHIIQDLSKKMVFIGGPRQVGKTTLSKALCKEAFADGEYFNWDIPDFHEDEPLTGQIQALEIIVDSSVQRFGYLG